MACLDCLAVICATEASLPQSAEEARAAAAAAAAFEQEAGACAADSGDRSGGVRNALSELLLSPSAKPRRTGAGPLIVELPDDFSDVASGNGGAGEGRGNVPPEAAPPTDSGGEAVAAAVAPTEGSTGVPRRRVLDDVLLAVTDPRAPLPLWLGGGTESGPAAAAAELRVGLCNVFVLCGRYVDLPSRGAFARAVVPAILRCVRGPQWNLQSHPEKWASLRAWLGGGTATMHCFLHRRVPSLTPHRSLPSRQSRS